MADFWLPLGNFEKSMATLNASNKQRQWFAYRTGREGSYIWESKRISKIAASRWLGETVSLFGMWKNDCWSSNRLMGKKKWNRVINTSRESAIFLFSWGQSVRVSDSSAFRICCETQLNSQTKSLECQWSARNRQDSNFWQRDNYHVFAASRIFAQTIFF